MNEKPDNAYCCWCGKWKKHLMPKNRFGEQVCPICDEDEDYIEHVKRLERIKRISERKMNGTTIKPSEVY